MKFAAIALLAVAGATASATASAAERVVDIPTRPGVTQRFVLITPPGAKAAVVLFAGGDGGLQISESGAYTQLRGNFLVRSAQRFAAHQFVVAVIDAPSDKQSY